MITKFLSLRRHETAPFFCCFLILYGIAVAATIGLSATEALFLKEIGASYFPQMILIDSVVVMIAFFPFSRLTGKLSADAIFYLLSCLFGVMICACGIVLLFPAPPKIIYILLLPLFALFYELFQAHFAIYVVHFFDPMESKRLFPAIFSATTFGIITGGGLVAILLKFSGSAFLFFIWAAIIFGTVLAVRANRGNRIPDGTIADEEKHGGLIDELRDIALIVRQSRFIMLSLLFAFLAQVLVTGDEVVSSTVFAGLPRFADSESLMAFYGKLEMAMGGCALVIQLLLIPCLIRRFGVGTVAVITPVLQLLAFGGLAFGGAEFMLGFAILARFNVAASCDYIDPIAQNLELNTLSMQQKCRVVSLSHGIIGQLGPIIAGSLLTGFTLFGGVLRWTWVFLCLSGGILFVAFHQYREFSRELIRLLENHDFNLFKAATGTMHSIDNTVYTFLENNLVGEDKTNAVISAQLLAGLRGADALPALCGAFSNADTQLRSSLLSLIASIGKARPEVSDAIHCGLAAPDPDLQREALNCLFAIDGSGQKKDRVVSLLESSFPCAATLAAIFILDRGNAADIRQQARRKLIQLLDGDPQTAADAVEAFALLRQPDPDLVGRIVVLLTAPMPLDRQAAITLQRLACDGLEPVLGSNELRILRANLVNPDREIRMAVHMVLGATGHTDEAVLLDGLDDRSKRIRDWMCDHVMKRGLISADRARAPATDCGHYLWRSMHILLAQHLGRNNDPALLCLIDATLEKAAEAVSWQAHFERNYPGEQHLLLHTLLSGRVEFMLTTAFMLLEYLSSTEIAVLVKKCLQSRNQRIRASAMECLEQFHVAGIKHTVRLFEPFIVDVTITERLHLLQPLLTAADFSEDDVLAFMLKHADSWEQRIIHNSLGAGNITTALRVRGIAGVDDSDGKENGDAMNNLIEWAIALKKVYVFEKLSAKQLGVVATSCEEFACARNKVIFREGEMTETFYLIIEGSVRVVKDMESPRQRIIAKLKAGDFFGEMSLFDGLPHSATICAHEECRFLLIRKEKLYAIIDLYPDVALHIINVFSRRLRDANEHAMEPAKSGISGPVVQ